MAERFYTKLKARMKGLRVGDPLDKAMDHDKRIVLVTQRSAEIDDPAEEDLFRVGTLATVLQLLKLPDGTTKVLVEGGERVTIDRYTEESGFFEAEWSLIPVSAAGSEKELEVTMRSLVSLFEQYVKLNRKIPPELLTTPRGRVSEASDVWAFGVTAACVAP